MRHALAASIALSTLGAAPPSGPVEPAQPPSMTATAESEPATQWAVSFLLNAAFAAEYLAAAEVAALDPTAKQAFLSDGKAAALAARARFALAAARARSQELGFADALQRAFAERGLEAGAPAPGPESVAPTLAGTPLEPHWKTLGTAYEASAPTCPLEAAEVIAFAAFQKKAMDEKRALTAAELLARVEGFSGYKTRCLVFALMGASEGAKRETGFEPLHLMRALRQQGSLVLEERALRSLMAVRLLQVGDYAESLRLLVEMTDVEPAFRLPYEVVQRIFGLRQRGEGEVALRGM
jgi:hypothetical protein